LQGFEWVVRNVQKLRDYIEGLGDETDSSQDLADDFEILKSSPTFGDHKFKVEICMLVIVPQPSLNSSLSARIGPDTDSEQPQKTISSSPQSLWLYITSLTVEYALAQFELSAGPSSVVLPTKSITVNSHGSRYQMSG
jgi:hypothetical protein